MVLKILRARSFAQFTLSEQSKILRVVYPERQCEILRCAQDDSERAQVDSIAAFFRSLFRPEGSLLERARVKTRKGLYL